MELAKHDTRRQVEFVLTLSTQCNQRCRYCYQHARHQEQARMSVADLARLFGQIASYYGSLPRITVSFVWHGGEPLLAPPEDLRAALAAQRLAFRDARCRVVNSIQTNLTLLDDQRLELLRSSFPSVGTSLDVVGGLRVDEQGRCHEDRILAHITRLRQVDVSVGAIAVLSRANLDQIATIYAFFRHHSLSFRLLPLLCGSPDASLQLSVQETRTAFCEVADLWFGDDVEVDVWPVTSCLSNLLCSRLSGARHKPYDKAAWESVLVVDVDGSLYGYLGADERQDCYGNIFVSPLDELLAGEGRRRALARVGARQRTVCGDCPYHGGACTGFPIAEGVECPGVDTTPGACVAFQGLLQHLEARLIREGLLDTTGALTKGGRAIAKAVRRNREAALQAS